MQKLTQKLVKHGIACNNTLNMNQIINTRLNIQAYKES